MWKIAKPVLLKLLTSKKAWATAASVTVTILGYAGWAVDQEAVLPVVIALSGFAVAQGFADIGKEAKLIEVEASKAKVDHGEDLLD